MKVLSKRKLSILGVVLLAASAVTAAVVPSKSIKSDGNDNGSLRLKSGGNEVAGDEYSCVTEDTLDASCTKTEVTDSSVGADNQSGGTNLNTSVTRTNGEDTQSEDQ